MRLAETSEDEEQAIDHLLGELGIRLPAVEVNLSGEDSFGPIFPSDPDQPMLLDDIREWYSIPSS